MSVMNCCAYAEIKKAYKIAAQVVKLYGEPYLPIFQRLHEELEKQSTASQMKSLALQIAAE